MNSEELSKKVYEKIQIRKFAKNNLGLQEQKENYNINTNNPTDELKKICDNLENVNGHWKIDDEWIIKSHRKVIGRFIIFGKRFIRKFLRWYINPIVEQQNIYNSYNTKTLNEMKLFLEKASSLIKNKDVKVDLSQNQQNYEKYVDGHNIQERLDIIDTVIADMLRKENEDKNLEIESLKQNIYNDLLVLLNDKMKNISEIEHNAINKEKEEIANYIQSLKQNMYKDLGNLLLNDDNEYNNEKISIFLFKNGVISIDDVVSTFKNKAMKQITKHNDNSMRRNIIILCKGFKIESVTEAIKKEAYTCYINMRKKYGEIIKFVSIEDQDGIEKEKDGIYYISNSKLVDDLNKLNPYVIHIFESNPHILFSNNCGLLKYNILFTLTGQEPFPNMDSWAIDELKHFNDNGKVKFIVESVYAQNIFKQNGFKDPYLLYPVMNLDIGIDVNKSINKSFTIGFASSPIESNQISSRGIELIGEIAKILPQYNFKIAWRNKSIDLPESIDGLSNIQILYGTIDMDTFYKSVDCIIIPYTTTTNNHACSFSAVEAMIRGIPVVSTDISGVSDIVKLTGSGEVCRPDPYNLARSLKNVKDNYKLFTNLNNVQRARDIFDNNNFYVIGKIYFSFPNEPLPMLKKWDEELRDNGKYLVKGFEKIKQYYSDINIATNYNETRFKDYPMNLYDAFERQAIDIIIESEFGTKDLKLLDIATGDGRILQENLKYGECTVIDSSKEMLNIVLKKYGNNNNLTIIKGDYFEKPINDVFNIITCFRYIRHFEYTERKRVYEKVKTNLDSKGIFIFDIPNLNVELKLRELSGWHKFNIYDVFWTEDSIKEELQLNGFSAKYIIPIGENLIENLPCEYKKLPLSYIIGAYRIGGDTIN